MDIPDSDNWLQEIRVELKEQIEHLSEQYNYDFLKDKPIDEPFCKYKWIEESYQLGLKSLRRCKTMIDSDYSKISIKRMNSLTSIAY